MRGATGSTRTSGATRTSSSTRTFALAALGIYAASRLLSGLLIRWVIPLQVPNGWTGDPVTYLGMTVLWDGTWYRRIAEHGYPATLPVDALGQVQQSEWAFYPLFPLLARALMTVTGLGFPAVASTLALVLGAVATVLIALLLRRWLPDRLALVALACWCTYLATPTLQLAYTESMALALLAAFLALVLRRSWWAAAAVALVLGLARPIALPLAIVGLAACLQRWHGRRAQPLRRGEATAMVAMLVSCGIAGLLWPGLAWLGTGIPDAYTQTMSAWRAGHEIHAFTPWWHNARFFFGDVWGPVLLVVLPVLYLVVVLGPWARPVDLVVRVWLLAYPLYLGAVLDPISSTYRYLLPLFPVAAILVGWGRGHRVLGPLWWGLLLAVNVATQVWWVRHLLVYYPPASWPP